MKIKSILTYNNCFFLHDQRNEKLRNNLPEYLIIASNQHSYNTRRSKYKTIIHKTYKQLYIINSSNTRGSKYKTIKHKAINCSTTYSLNSIKHRAASHWQTSDKANQQSRQ